ncbi:MAG: efflux RND transporter permease subunit, partial [Deltaproteobacteria bacterium]|nr:efflux RND transporter permease subunit [Deltaproteobacteria bacterium]
RAVDQVDDLPIDLEDRPVVTEVRSKDQPIVEVSLSGDISEAELVHHAKILENKLLDLPQVSSVVRRGWREKEIWVEADPQKLAEYSFSLTDLLTTLESANVNIPGGELLEQKREFLIRSTGEFETAEDVKKVVLRANDSRHWVAVEDVAEVKEAFEEETIINRSNGARAINLVVVKKETADAIDLVDTVKKLAQEYQAQKGNGLRVSFIHDLSFYIKRRLNVLYGNGAFGFILVVVCLLFFINRRVALITSLGTPFALCGTIFIMQLTGITLNLLTMFGLIMVLGMLDDDAVVVSENIYRLREEGLSMRDACLRGVLEVWKPVTISALTTIAAFLPLMFMTGIMGKFIFYIPLMVVIALCVSLFEIFLIFPSHLHDWAGGIDMRHSRTQQAFDRFAEKYVRWLKVCLQNRYRVALGFFIFFLFGIFVYSQVPFTLFPKRGVEIFFVRAKAPVGTPLEETGERFKQLERLIDKLEKGEVEDYVTQVGIQQNDPSDPFTDRFSHIGQIAVYLTPPSHRDRDAQEIVDDLRARGRVFVGLTEVNFELMRPGPPVGKPIAIRVRGEDLSQISPVASRIETELRTFQGVTDIKLDEELGKEELLLKVDRVKMAQAGLSIRDIGTAIRASFEGLIATIIRRTDEEINVRVRFPLAQKHSRESFGQILIPNRQGRLIHFSEVAALEEAKGINAIRHHERQRTITVIANVDEETITTVEVQKKMEKGLRNLQNEFPELTIQFGGEFEETTESLATLKQAFFLAMLLIFGLLVLQCNSFWQPFVVMSSIPLGLIGVLIAFWLHGEPKSFLGLMGMVGLAGVVVNNAIVLVDFINEGRKKGLQKLESIVQACSLRIRPIFLSSATTVLGLVSLAYGLWGSDPFLRPMAMAFVWGLSFATILTLIAVPCFHAIGDDLVGKLKKKIKTY